MGILPVHGGHWGSYLWKVVIAKVGNCKAATAFAIQVSSRAPHERRQVAAIEHVHIQTHRQRTTHTQSNGNTRLVRGW